MGGLLRYLSQSRKPFQPSNITWAHVPPLEGRFKKHEKKAALAARALRDIEVWRDAQR
jgi:methylenetetrahydrofolate--tRNA-(uracil-5-)-methyltransferase